MKNYEEFTKEADYPVLDINDGIRIYNQMMTDLPDEEDAKAVLADFYACVRDYATMRGEWQTLHIESKIMQDRTRTIHHDSVIIHINMIKKYLEQKGRDISYFNLIKHENRMIERKLAGDFACIVFCLMGIESR